MILFNFSPHLDLAMTEKKSMKIGVGENFNSCFYKHCMIKFYRKGYLIQIRCLLDFVFGDTLISFQQHFVISK